MKILKEKFKKLDKLTSETYLLTNVLDDALKKYDHKAGIYAISFLSTIIRKKFDEIRELF